MSFNTFYLNSENQSGIIDGSNVVVGGKMGVSIDPPQYTLDVSGTTRSTNLLATTATITNLDISGDTVDITSLQTKVENTQTVSFSVVVASKTSNAANSSGSSSGYFINHIETPYIHFTAGKTYRFDQSDSTNSSHPILFYLDEDKTSQYSTGITTSGTAGSSGAYVEIAVTSSTPTILYYQCQNHAYMGGTIYVKGTNVTSITSVGTLTAGTWNASTIQKQYIDTQSISINDLSNVVYTASSMTEGQTLVWNPTGQTWVPGTIALETLPSSIYLNGGKSKVMEKIAGVCDGRTISGEMTNYTLQTVSTYQDISTTLVDVEGSSITYSPPLNASQVVYTFAFNIVDISNEASMFNQSNDLTVRFYVDGTEVTNQTAQISSYLYNNGSTYTYTAILDIGNVSSNDISNGKLASWSTGKTLKLMASNSEADYPIRIFAIKTLSSNQYISEFIPPTLQVSSIGNLNTYPFENTTINDLSDVSFNSATTTDGQALVWNSTTQVWEAGVVASSGGGGGGGLTDLSASSINDLSDVSFNSTSTTDGQALVWDATNKIWTPGTVATTSSSTTSVMSLNPGDFKVLEKIAGVCDGRTISGETAAYTLENVTAYQDISTTLVDVEGSSISYTPPNNTKQVLYNFRFNVTDISNEANVFNQNHALTLHLYIDNIEITNQKAQISSYMYNHGHYFNYSAIIDVGSVLSDDITNGKLSTWSSSKTLKLMTKNSHGDYLARLFSIKTVSSGAYIHTFVPPTIEVASVGDVSNISFSTISIADLSDISFNSSSTTDGQALVWNSTDGVWEAGTVASSGGVSSGDDISFNNLDISGVLATNKSNNEIKLGAHLIPTTNSTYDLGSAEYKIRHLFLSSNSLWVGEDHKIEVSDGKMRFRKLKKDALPSGISAIPEASLEDAVAVLGKTPGSNASAFSLADWEAYSIAKGNPLKIDEIFLPDDINDDDGLTDTINSSDISFNVVDASGLNVFGTASMQSIIPPITNTYTLGDPSHVWKDVYIGPGSLYIDGQKVLESDANTIVVGADENQNLKLNTTGTGVLQIESAAGIQISSTGAGNIELGSTGTGIVRITDNLALNGNVEIFNDSSDMVKINDSLMVTGDISFNGNLYQNGVLFQSGSGGGGGLTDLSATSISDLSDVSLNGIQVNQTLKWDGEKLVPTTLATTATKQGQVLETLTGICNGSSVTVESGTYTLPNVTAVQDLTETFVDLTGSNISYKPPTGTKTVIYKWRYRTNPNDGQWVNMGYQLYIDNVAFGKIEFNGNYEYMDSYGIIEIIINITGSNDYANHSIASWDSLKTLKLKGRERGSTRQSEIHAVGGYTQGMGGETSGTVRPPRMTIIAIGESSGQAVTLTNNSVNDLSDISFNSSSTTDGQALVWNSTDGVWEAGNSSSSPWTTSSSDIYYNSGNVGIGTTNPNAKLTVTGESRLNGTERTSHINYATSEDTYIRGGKFSSNVLINDNGGNVGIGTGSPSYKLHVNGSLFYSSGGLNGSDDRIKHNEQQITNALFTISKLTPKHYFKTGTKMYDASHNFVVDASGNPLDSSGNLLKFKEEYTIETGIIAQEIRSIPELQFAVYGEEYVEETVTTYKKDNSGNDILDDSGNKIVENVETQQKPNTLAVDYNSIHCTHIAATKELHQLVESQQTTIQTHETTIQTQQQEINSLKQEIQSIKQHLGI